jgi:hypothetical protein
LFPHRQRRKEKKKVFLHGAGKGAEEAEYVEIRIFDGFWRIYRMGMIRCE